MIDGGPAVVWSPKQSEAEEAKQVYTIYGKKTLEAGEQWTPVGSSAFRGCTGLTSVTDAGLAF